LLELYIRKTTPKSRNGVRSELKLRNLTIPQYPCPSFARQFPYRELHAPGPLLGHFYTACRKNANRLISIDTAVIPDTQEPRDIINFTEISAHTLAGRQTRVSLNRNVSSNTLRHRDREPWFTRCIFYQDSRMSIIPVFSSKLSLLFLTAAVPKLPSAQSRMREMFPSLRHLCPRGTIH